MGVSIWCKKCIASVVGSSQGHTKNLCRHFYERERERERERENVWVGYLRSNMKFLVGTLCLEKLSENKFSWRCCTISYPIL